MIGLLLAMQFRITKATGNISASLAIRLMIQKYVIQLRPQQLPALVMLMGFIQRTSKTLATASERFLARATCPMARLTAVGVRPCTMGFPARTGAMPLVFLPVGVADAKRQHNAGG